MPPVRQPSFAGGELAPQFWARSDLERFAHGARRMRNFFAAITGAAVSRPGTTYVAEVKDSSKKVRLIEFVYSEDFENQSYAIELGDHYIRFHSNAAPVLDGVGAVYEISSPYLEADLARLKFAQVGDVVTITHPSYDVYELRRNAHADWTLTALSFDPRPFTAPSDPMVVAATGPSSGDATHPAREWVYQVTVIGEDADGTVWESVPFTITDYKTAPSWLAPGPTTSTALPAKFAVYQEFPIELDWASNGLWSLDFRYIAHRVYRGRGGVLGFIGETNTFNFVDTGNEPDYSQPPPKGRNPFKVYGVSDTLVRTEKPACVTFFEQRRVFGRTNERPGTVWASATGDFANFDDRVPSVDDEALELELASMKREEIRNLLGLDRLLVLTGSNVWAVSGPGEDPLTPTTVPVARVQVGVGSSWVSPLVVGDSVLYVRTKGSGVRDIFIQGSADGRKVYGSTDISLVSQHLFRPQLTIAEWAYAEDPWSVIWAVRSDGNLLSLTYTRELGVSAWAWHDTDGTFESVCSIPEGDEDAVYVVVKRTIGGVTRRYVERFATRVIDDVKEAVCVDCAVIYRGDPATTFSGLDHLEGKSVYVLADGVVFGPLTVTSGAVTIELEGGASVAHIGLAFTPQLETLDLLFNSTEVRTKQKTVTGVGFDVEASVGLFVGERFEKMNEWKQRKVSDGYGAIPLETGFAKVVSPGSWNTGGRAVLEQRAPLPVTVLGITREVSLGD